MQVEARILELAERDAPPVGLFGPRLVRKARAAGAAETLRTRARPPVLVGLSTYAVAAAVARLIVAIADARPGGALAIVLDVALIAIALGAAAFARR